MEQTQKQPGKKASDLFWEALERSTPEERAAFLDQACGDDLSLRAQVEALLRNHQADDFLESPAVAVNAGTTTAQAGQTRLMPGRIGEGPGDRVGRYRLLQQIGEGGVGVVFMAEQEAPVRRRVAVKILKPGMDTKSVIARFESERQAMALMDHPNIAQVFDAGSTPSGRPYFVMELVRGVPITEYCDQNRLPTRERLALFIQVCQAIQHAHQKGVIHRDIKPSNILVTLHDGVPVPKVIDFGIAKAIGQRLTDKTFFTEFHSFVGTPAYVSPEQAEMSGLDIDTRTDIYSLGVLLYELLTGRTPFDTRELIASGLDGMRRTICEKEPTPPSTRLRLLPEAEQTTTAQRQQSEPARLISLLRGDLDWIVLKALEKDRTRRYATANALALDIRRYLDNEPVLARPPSAMYRISKLVRRNRMLFAGAGAFAAALVIGLVMTTWQWLEKDAAYRQVLRAEQEQSRLRREAETARNLAEAQTLAARRQAYAADMNLVQQALAANNLGRAQELLDRHRPAGGAQSSNLRSQIYADLRGWEWRYLWEQCRSDALFRLCKLSNEVSELAVSHDGKWVAIGEYGGRRMSIWDLRSREEVAQFNTGPGRRRFAFSPVNSLLAFYAAEPSGRAGPRGSRGSIRLWDMAARRIIGEIPFTGYCRTVVFSPDGSRLMAASGDGAFTVFSVPDGAKLSGVTLAMPKGSEVPPWFSPLAISRDLRLAAEGLGGGRIRVMDLTSGEELWTAQAAEENVTALAFSPDGKWLASGAGYVESAVRLWDVATGRESARLEGHRTYVRALLFWPDGKTLASASGDQTIHLWDIGRLEFLSLPAAPASSSAGPTDPSSSHRSRQSPLPELRPRATLRGHRLEVWSLALCPDQTTLVSGSKDGSVLVWDTAAREHKAAYVTLPVAMRAWAFLPDGRAIVGLDEQGRVLRWDGVDFQHQQIVLELGTNAMATCFSADGRHLAAATAGRPIQMWDLEQGVLLREITSEEGAIPVAFVGGSNHLVTRQRREGTFREWDVSSGREIRQWQLPGGGRFGKNLFSSDGQWLVAVDANGVAQRYRLDTGQTTRLELRLRQISAGALSPDGRRLTVVSILGSGQLHDLDTGELLATFRGFLQGTHSVCFSPDGRRVAIGSNGSEAIKLWDAEGYQELLTLQGQGSMFGAIAFSPDGDVLAAANSQGIVHLWRAPSLEEIAHRESPGP